MDLMDSLVKMLSSLAVVVALMVLVAAAARRWLKPALAGNVPFTTLRLRNSLALGGRRSVLILEVAGKTLVIGATAQQLVLLTQFDSHPSDAEATAEIDAGVMSVEPDGNGSVPVHVRVNEAIRNHRMGLMGSRS